MWRSLRLINTPVVEPQNEFPVARAPTVPDTNEVQVSVNNDFSETFDREKFDVKAVSKGNFNHIVTDM